MDFSQSLALDDEAVLDKINFKDENEADSVSISPLEHAIVLASMYVTAF